MNTRQIPAVYLYTKCNMAARMYLEIATAPWQAGVGSLGRITAGNLAIRSCIAGIVSTAAEHHRAEKLLGNEKITAVERALMILCHWSVVCCQFYPHSCSAHDWLVANRTRFPQLNHDGDDSMESATLTVARFWGFLIVAAGSFLKSVLQAKWQHFAGSIFWKDFTWEFCVSTFLDGISGWFANWGGRSPCRQTAVPECIKLALSIIRAILGWRTKRVINRNDRHSRLTQKQKNFWRADLFSLSPTTAHFFRPIRSVALTGILFA